MVAGLLNIVETITTGRDDAQKEPASVSANLLASIERGINIKDLITMHAEAFGAGYITLKRVLEVAVYPFLKLAAKINKAEHTAGTKEDFQALRCRMLSGWSLGLKHILGGGTVCVGPGDFRCMPLIADEKRAEIVYAMVHEHCFRVCPTPYPTPPLCTEVDSKPPEL